MLTQTPADPTLARLAADAWETALTAHPTHATAIGDRRFDDRLPPNDPADEATLRARYRELLDRSLGLAATELSADDRVTRSALLAFLRAELDLLETELGRWTVDPLEGPQVAFMDLEAYQRAATPLEAAAMLARWSAMGPWLDRHVASLRTSLAEGRVSPRSPVRRVIAELDGLLAQPTEAWPLLRPLAVERPDWTAAERSTFAAGLKAAAELGLRPAIARYRAFLADELVSVARSDERPGLMHVPGGADAYARVARAHTSLELSPEAIHRIGLAETERIDAELEALAGRVLRTRSRAEAIRRLRGDPDLHFATGAEVRATADASLARANAALGDWFGVLPAAPCVVEEIPPHEAEHSTIAYYREPAADGSRPGQYFVNTALPRTRPRYEAEALAFHESIPGHHLQIAIAQEVAGLPAFRRFAGTTAFVEGWGLYSERLADEMGLYTGDLDRVGILSFDGWRACRLVVDTGMHALGWSRQRAIDFMVEHTALAENNIANEVDRYITWPGHALAYKLGQLELLRLRAIARDRLGSRFDVRAFHAVALGQGALRLATLGEVVEAWIGARTEA